MKKVMPKLLTLILSLTLMLSCTKQSLHDLKVENVNEKTQHLQSKTDYKVITQNIVKSREFKELNSLLEELAKNVNLENFDMTQVRVSDQEFNYGYIQNHLSETKFSSSNELTSLIIAIETNLESYRALYPSSTDEKFGEGFSNFLENEPAVAEQLIAENMIVNRDPGDCRNYYSACRAFAALTMVSNALNGNISNLTENFNAALNGCWLSYSACLLNQN
ncbi:MAG: hypothetical protein AB8B56_14170 [Crocinitomicaceae bacterium]